MQAKLNSFGPVRLIADYDLFAEDDAISAATTGVLRTARKKPTSLRRRDKLSSLSSAKLSEPGRAINRRQTLGDFSRTLKTIRAALRLSAYVLADDAAQLPSQLWARLVSENDTQIRALLDQIKTCKRTWLRSNQTVLRKPGSPLLGTFEGHERFLNCIAVTPDNTRAITGSADRTLSVWDLESGSQMLRLLGHSDAVTDVVVIQNGNQAVSSSKDRTIKIWNLETGHVLDTLHGAFTTIYGVAATPDGRQLVSACEDKTLKIWDLVGGRKLRTLIGHLGSVYGVALTPNGRQAISASADCTVKIWDLATGGVLRTLRGHSGFVLRVVITRDGKRIISASTDETLKI